MSYSRGCYLARYYQRNKLNLCLFTVQKSSRQSIQEEEAEAKKKMNNEPSEEQQ